MVPWAKACVHGRTRAENRASGTDWLGVRRVGGRSFYELRAPVSVFSISHHYLCLSLVFPLTSVPSFVVTPVIKTRKASVLIERDRVCDTSVQQRYPEESFSYTHQICTWLCFLITLYDTRRAAAWPLSLRLSTLLSCSLIFSTGEVWQPCTHRSTVSPHGTISSSE